MSWLGDGTRQILKQVHRAFTHALRDLPPNEYLFFDIPNLQPTRPSSASSGENDRPMPMGSNLPQAADATLEAEPVLFPAEPGPLATVEIRPKSGRREIGQQCPLLATPKDAEGQVLPEGVEFHWDVTQGQAVLLQIDGPRCRATSQHAGAATVRVEAVQGEHRATADCDVKFFEEVSPGDRDSAKGLPSYRLQADRGGQWRSRYDAPANEIAINSAHRDFLASKQTGAKHRRYIGKLYAKEVVLINFAHESPAQVMDRLIEVLVRTEDAL